MTAKGYWIASIQVEDAAEYARYVELNGPIYAAYGGTPIVRGGRFEPVEGPARDRNVVIEFPSYEQALACYHSPEYAEARLHRQRGSDGTLLIVEGA